MGGNFIGHRLVDRNGNVIIEIGPDDAMTVMTTWFVCDCGIAQQADLLIEIVYDHHHTMMQSSDS